MTLLPQRLGELWGRGLQNARQPFKAGCGRNDDSHLMPCVGDSVAEGMHEFSGVGRKLVVGDEHDAGGANGEEARTICDRANAAG